MTVYLTVITTALVITQLIRLAQNAINLHRQNKLVKEQLEWLDRKEVTEDDFETQREVFRLLRKRLEEDGEADDWYYPDPDDEAAEQTQREVFEMLHRVLTKAEEQK